MYAIKNYASGFFISDKENINIDPYLRIYVRFEIISVLARNETKRL